MTAVAGHTWPDAPAVIVAQVWRLTEGLRQRLGDTLLGVYLHGSLAMGGFNSERSDIDLLAVTHRPLTRAAKRDVAEFLLGLSGAPRSVEISLLSRRDLTPWTFPTPFDFHFSEMWRERIAADVASGAWRRWGEKRATDPDLAAHITVLRHRGAVLWGPPIDRVLPEVPRSDYITAIWDHDTKGAAASIMDNPVYAVLNLCRVLLFLQEGRVVSKDEGGAWGGHALPPEYGEVVGHALRLYRGEDAVARFDPAGLRQFAEAMEGRIVAIQTAFAKEVAIERPTPQT